MRQSKLCPTCNYALAWQRNMHVCPNCGLQAFKLQIWTVPDEALEPWGQIVSWIDPVHGYKVTVRRLQDEAHLDPNGVMLGVFEPMAATWARRKVARNACTPERAELEAQVLVHGSGRDLVKEDWDNAQTEGAQ